MRITQHLRRRWAWWLAVLVVLVAVIWVDRILTAPAVGHTETPQLKVAQTAPKTQAVPPASRAANQYYQLALPPGYTPQASTQPSGLLLAQTILKPGAQGTLIINIGVSRLSAGGLAANSSYKLRANDTQTYAASELDGVTVFTRLDGMNGEVVAFWPHGSELATISVTDGVGNAGSGDVATDRASLDTLLKLWQWR
ncbi:MAG TPA: hypothetical protein VG992_04695 [Candidatus Saccharimonadales bacterium]|nr:hypothetical protein [Candidatus Saccharimonadales bacterium]